MKKLPTILFTLIVAMSFVCATPDSTVSRRLTQNQIDVIKSLNTSLLSSVSTIAYAEATNAICCSNGESPTNADDYCDDLTACTPMCCPNGSNPNIGYRCDNNLPSCSEKGGCESTLTCGSTTTTPVLCNDTNAQNHGEPIPCLYLYTCCEKGDNVKNYDEANCDDPHYKNSPSYCQYKDPVCCDGNWDTYTPPSERNMDNVYCVYNGSPCGCNATPPHTGSQCGSGQGDYCSISTGFSVVKSGVAIGGTASMDVLVACGSLAQQNLKNQVAGLAAADATPATPLNTPITLDALSSYIVTSKDYCLNIPGVQGAGNDYNRSEGGLCCEAPLTPDDTYGTCTGGPACGLSNGQSLETPPTSDLCSNGTPSNVQTSTTTYSWACSMEVGSSTYSNACSAWRTCNGASCEVCTDLDCGANDLCKNITGSQDSAYLSSNNLAPDSYNVCWNSTTGACGTISQIPYVTEIPSTNLCISGTSPSSVSYDADAKIYSWNCSSIVNTNIISPMCQVRECQGTECQTDQSSTLIKNFKAQPSIVSKIGDGCNLTWETNVDSSIVDPAQQCLINGNAVADNNTTGTRVGPGTYSLMCRLGVSFQIKNLKCSIGPDYKEI